ncbi:chemotaxis protein CheD [Dyella mobilis]|uniref:Chemotaxis protein CheD n=2 Tax=Dyella mobilis TaxID=1849582 RepID=A0ABS2KFD9_9GAMM|nr:chemotaxis protein CheD [Dyella mobilis]MBM7129595.1 chemotaxis protein CheD [Dyella mobilis]
MCEIGIGRGHDVLRATLGSCVGIGLMWRNRGVYGLAHCLLPEAREPSAGIGAKYVTLAVPSLLKLMSIDKADVDQIEAVIAGGASMVQQQTMPRHGIIGDQNAQAAKRLLAAAGIRVVHEDLGGEQGRQLLIDCAQHCYAVRTFSRAT